MPKKGIIKIVVDVVMTVLFVVLMLPQQTGLWRSSRVKFKFF